jgi:flap endonuclease-1
MLMCWLCFDSHLQGMFYRTLRMLDNGIKPVFVFDGAAPTLKNGELAKRRARLSEANTQLEEAKQSENVEDIKKYEKRTVRVTKYVITIIIL